MRASGHRIVVVVATLVVVVLLGAACLPTSPPAQAEPTSAALRAPVPALGGSSSSPTAGESSSSRAAVAVAKPRITAQPRSSLAVAGRHAAIEVSASGTGKHYQWQRRAPGGAWKAIAGATTSRYSAVARTTPKQLEYRVVVSNAGGSVRSRVATVFTVSCFGAPSMKPALAGCPTSDLAKMIRPSPQKVGHDWGGRSRCWADSDTTVLKRCTFPASGPRAGVPHVALVGDSHARMYLPSLIWLANRGTITLDTYLKGSCGWSTAPPVRGTIGTTYQKTFTQSCATWRTKLNARLVKNPGEYDAVVTTASRGTRVLYPRGVSTAHEKRVFRRDAAVKAWKPVLAKGIRVFAIRDNPTPGTPTKTCLLTTGKTNPARCAFSRASGTAVYDPIPGAVARSGSRAHLVDLTWRFCTSTRCPVVIGGANVYRDDHHVSVTYTTTLAPYIWRKISRYLA
ncbi:SGNH hydrolase domain-containing protein [Cellulomonas edaphi]|uniref:SGNH hydrolase domain-containing protein n=1 Tax=Cellulomonas edaphi TaxID=3053468 RepID=A0ABT7S898_9CELL|nr:SGNH hydrolase domain-containing protein [Cellulomons edaphi]MDM7831759.1 SGNH hydrolase domain-containing protein [Cellulomons edaphi]